MYITCCSRVLCLSNSWGLSNVLHSTPSVQSDLTHPHHYLTPPWKSSHSPPKATWSKMMVCIHVYCILLGGQESMMMDVQWYVCRTRWSSFLICLLSFLFPVFNSLNPINIMPSQEYILHFYFKILQPSLKFIHGSPLNFVWLPWIMYINISYFRFLLLSQGIKFLVIIQWVDSWLPCNGTHMYFFLDSPHMPQIIPWYSFFLFAFFSFNFLNCIKGILPVYHHTKFSVIFCHYIHI